jgi:hypothetical protein
MERPVSDPKDIKKQTSIDSAEVTPESAEKDVSELSESQLGKVAGGAPKLSGEKPYGDWLG